MKNQNCSSVVGQKGQATQTLAESKQAIEIAALSAAGQRVALLAWVEQAFRPASKRLPEQMVIAAVGKLPVCRQGYIRLTGRPYRESPVQHWHSQTGPEAQGWRLAAAHWERLPARMGDFALPPAAGQADLRLLLAVRWVQFAKKAREWQPAPGWPP